ncbi:hypothetical protein Tco_0955324 [Tanacetum coccineum]|uniref:Uncharacterized protein n=1 Tax=Tanacetum coccineum TaxID=301880 RepID=A0ABQ5E6V5_9ASTR
MADDINQDAGITLVTPTKTSTQEDHLEDQLGVMSAAKVLIDVARVYTYSRRRRTVSTGSGKVSTASRIISTVEETISTVGASMPVSTAGLVQEITSSSRASKDKGKAVITESEPEQTASKDAEIALRLQEEIDAAGRQRMAKVHQAAQGFTDDEWENIRARVEADEELTQKLQEKEREKYSKLKSLSFEEVKEIFETTMRRVYSFVPMDSELEVQRLKRAGQEVLEEPAKRQKFEKASRSALQVKYPIIDWEIFIEESRGYWRIIRVGNHTEVYQIFEDMLKRFDRDDLEKLWDLVKKRFRSTEPTVDKEKVLWVELKRLFEPDDDDTLWKLQRYMHDPLKWRLYDTFGVHHVSIERGHDIFMLVEKDYSLTRALMTVMLANKLQVGESSKMANELLKKIFILANNPRQ